MKLEDVWQALRPGDALLEYVRYRQYDFRAHEWGAERYGAFVLRHDGRVAAVDLGEANEIDDAVHAFRSEVENAAKSAGSGYLPTRKEEMTLANVSSKLRGLAWDPVREHFRGVRRVYVAPDGDLGLVPFEALAEDPKGRRYLAEAYELLYIGTGRDLGRLAMTAKPQGKSGGTAVLIGNPDLEASAQRLAEVVARLEPAGRSESGVPAPSAPDRGTASERGREEVHSAQPRCKWEPKDSLEKLVVETKDQLDSLGWSTATVLLDERAVEEAVYALKGPRILQFATHGELARSFDADAMVGWDNPLLRSTLLLAGVCSWQEENSSFIASGRKCIPRRRRVNEG